MTDNTAIRYESRVLVLELREPVGDFPFDAICIEMNLVGRGRSPAEAISDLADTVQEAIFDHLTSGSSLGINPDPALVDAFEKQSKEFEEDRVVGGYRLSVEILRLVGPNKAPPRLRRKDTSKQYVPAF